MKWEWSALCDEAVNTARQLLVSSKVLVHYNSNSVLPIVLATDASQYSIRAVLLHVCKDSGKNQLLMPLEL